jgi:hypothetical protein
MNNLQLISKDFGNLFQLQDDEFSNGVAASQIKQETKQNVLGSDNQPFQHFQPPQQPSQPDHQPFQQQSSQPDQQSSQQQSFQPDHQPFPQQLSDQPFQPDQESLPPHQDLEDLPPSYNEVIAAAILQNSNLRVVL